MNRIATLVNAPAVALVLLSAAPHMLTAQNRAAPLDAAPLDAAALKGLRWRSIGPANHSGRIADFAVARAPGVPDALYAAISIGGVWKTNDWGATWEPVFDSANGMSSIGSVSVAPEN